MNIMTSTEARFISQLMEQGFMPGEHHPYLILNIDAFDDLTVEEVAKTMQIAVRKGYIAVTSQGEMKTMMITEKGYKQATEFWVHENLNDMIKIRAENIIKNATHLLELMDANDPEREFILKSQQVAKHILDGKEINPLEELL